MIREIVRTTIENFAKNLDQCTEYSTRALRFKKETKEKRVSIYLSQKGFTIYIDRTGHSYDEEYSREFTWKEKRFFKQKINPLLKEKRKRKEQEAEKKIIEAVNWAFEE